MNFLDGIRCNFKGLWLGLKTPKLFILGMTRFAVLLFLAAVGATLIFSYHDKILGLVWMKPESIWISWLWYVVSFLIALILTGIASIIGYLAAQILFNVVIMEAMSQATERLVTGRMEEGNGGPLVRQVFFLIRQEIPRAILPIGAFVVMMGLGWLTPFGPVLSVVGSVLTLVFLAWDNTDLTPARRMIPFSKRFSWLKRTFFFHLGFGLPFLIPIANILLLAFAPVGGTLFHLEHPTSPTAKGGTL